ncbi:hypothetical protein [Pararhizobium sp. PWRC1-1]|uniref:hypothetical protein n=1 Tax=Pararhizobium sp. PWRC1-1 TaxID=2804566 RepID=UPI003CE749C7
MTSLLSRGTRAADANQEHKEIVNATLLARNSEAAESAARLHVRSSPPHLSIRNT